LKFGVLISIKYCTNDKFSLRVNLISLYNLTIRVTFRPHSTPPYFALPSFEFRYSFRLFAHENTKYSPMNGGTT